MFAREGEDKVDVIIGHELVCRLYEVEETDEEEFGVVTLQFGFQFFPFGMVLFGHLYVVFFVDVDNEKAGFEEIEDGLYLIDGDRFVDILEVGKQQNIFCRCGVSMLRRDDDGGDRSFDDVEGVASHEDLAEAGGSGKTHDDQLDIVLFYIRFERVEKMAAFFRYHGHAGIGDGGKFGPDAFEGEFYNRFAAGVFVAFRTERAAVGPIFQGVKNVVEDEMGIRHEISDMCGITGGVL